MKQYLVPILVLAAAVAQAQGSRQSDQKVAVAAVPAQPSAATAKPSGLRRLSAEERAELRRQLYQYSRLAGKGS
jgi:hypothetical protein